MTSTIIKIFTKPKKVFGSEEVSSDERRKAKAVNFGIIYGIGAWSLSDDIQTTPKEAQFIDIFEILKHSWIVLLKGLQMMDL